ncbi:uncharacterized protein BT62DRAFT_146144 [Guyanagaster necrorhizus]|uniref:MARVEL domain-containing protein n=1 Tax=Guyanagaster necrorhizus TaxID=856835 RepID=A0A9P8AS29_9AGAR|nr:uncharacterized protein BT62DRAFT_146144 [Guyanagaster necrorhizus MCA 3950]KAG7445983.1 hypothetical protein BT62DRAFT_146144 [Guyanagaster necrorhizus MCA 3950]
MSKDRLLHPLTMSAVSILRLTVLIATLVFSVIVLGVSAHITYLTTTFFNAYFTFAAMSIATACLTILTLPVMIAVDITRKGAFTSMVVVELSWLGVLWILWLTSAALTADANSNTFVAGCGYINPEIDQACKEFNAIEAFDFLTWLILMGYTITLIVFAIIAATRGNAAVWTSSTTTTDFFATGGALAPEKSPSTNTIQHHQSPYPQV